MTTALTSTVSNPIMQAPWLNHPENRSVANATTIQEAIEIARLN